VHFVQLHHEPAPVSAKHTNTSFIYCHSSLMPQSVLLRQTMLLQQSHGAAAAPCRPGICPAARQRRRLRVSARLEPPKVVVSVHPADSSSSIQLAPGTTAAAVTCSVIGVLPVPWSENRMRQQYTDVCICTLHPATHPTMPLVSRPTPRHTPFVAAAVAAAACTHPLLHTPPYTYSTSQTSSTPRSLTQCCSQQSSSARSCARSSTA
jgi:hypothetical protein